MNNKEALEKANKIFVNIFDRNNPFSLDEILTKFAFDIKLPQKASVSPIFVAAGKGVKSGYVMKRQMREVDIAPTVAAIMGVRMPAQADGAAIHQILAD